MSIADALRRRIHPLYRSLETRAHLLRYLFLEVTRRCNLACLHCGSDCGADPVSGELSPEEWVALIRSLPRRFDRERLLIVLTGGEPFCAPELDRILAALGEQRLAFGLVTNGWALTDENVARLVAHGVNALTVSLDGLAPSHDWLRGRAGAYDRALAGIRRAAAAQIPFFDVVTCAHPRNVGELPEVLARLRESGVRGWRIFSIIPRGRAASNAALRLSAAELRRLLEWIAELRPSLLAEGFDLQYGCEGFLPRDLDDRVREEPYFCRAGIAVGSVLADGAISACPNISRRLVQGSVRTDDLREVWESRFQPFRDRSWMQRGRCAPCAEWDRCRGNSLHLWDDESCTTVMCHRVDLGPPDARAVEPARPRDPAATCRGT